MGLGLEVLVLDHVNDAGVAELVDAPDLGSGGFWPWGFKSLHPHQEIHTVTQSAPGCGRVHLSPDWITDAGH